MESKIKYRKAITNIIFYIVVLILMITVVPRVILFFMPFVVGWIISAMANPVVKFFEEKIKFKRKTTSAVAIILILAIVISVTYGILYFLITQGIEMITVLPEKWPEIEATFNKVGTNFNHLFNGLPNSAIDSLNNIGHSFQEFMSDWVGTLGTPTINAVSNVAKGLPSLIVAIVMGVLSAYFFTIEHNNLSESIEKMLPESVNSRLQTVINGLKRAVGGYFVAQFKIEIWVYIITLVGLLILRIEFAAIIALGIAFMDFLPLFGAGLIMIPWAVIAFLGGDYVTAVGMLVVWGIGQLVRQFIQPKIVGDSVGLAPLPTLFFLFIGFAVGGMFGMIIAVPIGIIIVSLYEEGLFKSLIYSLRIIWEGISNFRHFTPEEIAEIENRKEEEKEK